MDEMPKKLLGELLIEDGALGRDHLDEALHHQKQHGGLIGQILISQGYITEDDLVAALGRQLGIPYLPIQNYTINPEAVVLFDVEYCRRNVFVVFDVDEKRIFVTLADPLNQRVIDEIAKKINKQLQLFISTTSEIYNVIDTVFSSAAKQKNL